MMDEVIFYDTLRQGLWASVIMSTPILAAALVSGLIVGLFQALTSIQEMTLTFVPKLGVMVGVFWISMAFMTETLTGYFQGVVLPLIAGG
ncbi:MAG: flagellar biosynthetic protein FliQ [Pseudomonadota bacterium]